MASKTTTNARHVPRGDKKKRQPALGQSAPSECLWTVEQVSNYLGVPVQTLYAWRCEGKGPEGHKVGKHLRFDPEDVRSWFKDQPA